MDKIEFIARVRHIGWVCYQIASGQEYNGLPNEDQLKSLMNGVRYALENPNMTAEENHNNWMRMKESQGWVYGPTKDFDKKTHPDMVPFDDLPEIEKKKDIMDSIATKLALELFWSLDDVNQSTCILCHMKNDTTDKETPQLCDTCKLEIYHEVAMKNVTSDLQVDKKTNPLLRDIGDEVETYLGYKGIITGKCELDNIKCRTFNPEKDDCSAKHCWAFCKGRSWKAPDYD